MTKGHFMQSFKISDRILFQFQFSLLNMQNCRYELMNSCIFNPLCDIMYVCILTCLYDKRHSYVFLQYFYTPAPRWGRGVYCFTSVRLYTPAPRRGRGVYCFTSVRLSKIFFVAFFSVTVDGRNLILGHKRHIGIPYWG